MRYELYIDVYFLINLLADTALLRLAAGILKRKAGPGRILAGGTAGAATACAAVMLRIYMPGNGAFSWLAGAASLLWTAAAVICCCVVAFRPHSVSELLKEILLLFFLAALINGLMEFLLEHTRAGYYAALAMGGDAAAGLSFSGWAFLLCGSVFLFKYLWMTASEIRRERAALCHVTLSVGERKLRVTAYRDSGNTLTEPKSGQPVSIVSEGIWLAIMREVKEQGKEIVVSHIPYRTIGSPLGVMEATQIDSLELYLEAGAAELSSRFPASPAAGMERENHPWIARAPFPLSREGSYEMLLHKDL